MSARAYFAFNMLEEAELADGRNAQKRHEAHMRSQMDPLRYTTERRFVKLYRLSKLAFVDLCELLRQHTSLKSTQRTSLEAKVLCALLFYAKGGYQCTIGEDNHCSQETMSVYINEVTTALTHPNILRRYIKFPASHLERDEIKYRFVMLTAEY
ncbi:uncharacterized protein LOC123702489 [Colias croceus]|uniref:uncharacterized protein LOC123702489 n=1 Tax=Colias crocea TaxID=72248 RepID=UPI001E27D716|nr:uncharacterized protein LOC123702489 [Colias croceus]